MIDAMYCSRHILFISLLIAPLACGVQYRPQFSGVNVTCTPSTENTTGQWMFSSWVEDGNGSEDVQEVEVSLLDFAGVKVKTIALERTEDVYWSASATPEEVGVSCDDTALYLYTFRAVDEGGEEATAEFSFP